MSNNLVSKIISISFYVIMGVSALLVILFYFGKIVPGTEGTNMEEPVITRTIITWAFILVGIAAILSITFPIINLILNPQNAKKAFVVLVFVAIIIFVAYLLASDEILNIIGYEGKDNVPKTLRYVGTGLFTMYILCCLAILSIIYSEITKFFK